MLVVDDKDLLSRSIESDGVDSTFEGLQSDQSLLPVLVAAD